MRKRSGAHFVDPWETRTWETYQHLVAVRGPAGRLVGWGYGASYEAALRRAREIADALNAERRRR